MSDYAVLGFLAMLAPIIVVGVLINIAFWIADRPLPYDEAYEHEQRRDRQQLARQRK